MTSVDILYRLRLCAAALFIAVTLLLPPVCLPAQGLVGGDTAPPSDPNTQYAGVPVTKLSIEIQECPWCTGDTMSLARDLISLKENQPFSMEGYTRSMENLTLSRRFEEELSAIEPVEGGIALTFYLTPAWVVRDIVITGHYPLFKSDVLKAMSVAVGEALTPAAQTAQPALIAELYRREGYVAPEATLGAEKDAGNGGAVLNVNIKAGRYYTFSRIKVHGNHAISTAEIKSRMRTWRSSFFIREERRYRVRELQQDIKDLESLYRQRGYADCKIDLKVETDPAQATVAADITITEGPRYEVRFSNNKRFWSYTLKKDLVLFKSGNLSRQGIRKSIANIVNRYRLAGYQSTTVEVLEEKITLQGRVTRKLNFVIKEGPCTQVGEIRFSGNQAYSGKALQKAMQTGQDRLFNTDRPFVSELLEADVAVLRSLYLKDGYTAVKISPALTMSEDKKTVDIAVAIEEGVRTTITDIQFEGITVIERDDALKALKLKKGEAFQEEVFQSDKIALANLISEKGYPYVDLKAQTLYNQDKTGVRIVFPVVEGKRVTMGRVYYQGNFVTRKRALGRELEVKPGEPFSLQTMLKGQKNIRSMGIFDSVQFKTMGLKEQADKVTLLVDMEEKPPYYVQSGAGYTSDRGLFANARLGDRNLLGFYDDVWLGGEVSQIGRNMQLNLTQHRIFGTPATSSYALSYDRSEPFNQTFGTSVWTASTNVLREFERQHLKTSLGLSYEHRDEFVIDPTAQDEDTYDPRGIIILTPSITYDIRDSFVLPKKGLIANATVDFSKGLQNSLDNFIKYYLTLRTYWSPVRRLTLACMGRWNYIQTLSKDSSIPQDQLFYNGGTTSVRGFDENMLRYDANGDPLGGRLSVVGSLEARIEATRNWEISLFYDTGTVRQTLSPGGTDDFRSSVGLGMRYITPIGPIGVLYGHKLKREEGESAGLFHLSFGYTF